MERKEWIFWVSITMKVLSLKPKTGFDVMQAQTKEEYWERVHTFLETGYRVQ